MTAPDCAKTVSPDSGCTHTPYGKERITNALVLYRNKNKWMIVSHPSASQQAASVAFQAV